MKKWNNMKLFLDDIRVPARVAEYCKGELVPLYHEEWQVVRNYKEFVDWILENGIPEVISFDHDLGHEHILLCDAKYTDWDQYYTEGNREMTGYDCAKWLVDFCMHEHLPLPICYVHSQNPVGAENIQKYLDNYEKDPVITRKEFFGEQKEEKIVNTYITDKDVQKTDTSDRTGTSEPRTAGPL